MKKIAIFGLAALMAASCSNKKGAEINAKIEGANNAEVVLYQLAVNQIKPVDTVKTGADGSVKLNVVTPETSPEFYYLTYKGNKLASFVLKTGDKVNVQVDTLGKGVTIEGSQESLLLGEYEKALAAVSAEFEAMAAQLDGALANKDQKAAQQINLQMGKRYISYRKEMIKKIMENPYSFANINALYQSISQQLPVFSDQNDYLLVQRVHDSLVTMYPASVYVKSLEGQIENALKALEFVDKVNEANEIAFPNISLPDVNAKNVELSSLEGKPFILMFWTITEPSQKMFNNDLKEIYKKYRKEGLEIYQVSIDSDKTAWAAAVREQKLPWISVCDGKGAMSPAIYTYNVATIPSMFVFNAKGEIVEKGNLTGQGKIEAAVKKALK